MPSFSQKINHLGQFIIAVKVFPPSDNHGAYDKAIQNASTYRALVDTGANGCCISNKIVDDLSLRPYSQREVMTAGEPHTAFVYLVGIAVPVTISTMQAETQEDGNTVYKPVPISETTSGLPQVHVTSFPDVGIDRGFDMLVGMDMLLNFHITIHNGIIVISI